MQPRMEELAETEELSVAITLSESGDLSVLGVIQNHQPTSPRTLLQRLNERDDKSSFPGQAFKLNDNDSATCSIRRSKKVSTRAKIGMTAIAIGALLAVNFFRKSENSNVTSQTIPSIRKFS